MKTFTETDLAAMREAAGLLKLGEIKVEEEIEEGATSLSLDGFAIDIEEGERQEMGLAGNRMVPCTDYVVYAEHYSAGSYWDPPEVDSAEIARENSPLNAIAAVALAVAQQQIDNVMESMYWHHYHADEPELVWCER